MRNVIGTNEQPKLERKPPRKGRKHYPVQLDYNTHKLLKEYCEKSGFKIQDIGREAVREYIKARQIFNI